MSVTFDTDVLIVGAGPVGMTLAMCLAERHVNCVVLEMKAADAPREVKCNHISARSMEVFRRLGVAQDLRASGLPDDYPHDVSYRTSTVGREITRIPIPGRLTRLTDRSGPDGWWPTPEPPHRLNQRYIEPILAQHMERHESIRCLYQHQVMEIDQDDQGARVQCQRLTDDAWLDVRARYVVGCDGARSLMRKVLGTTMLDLGLHQPWLVFDVRLKTEVPSLPDHTVQHCDPARPMTYCNVTGNRRRWEIMLMPGDDPEQLVQPETLWRLVSQWVTPEQADIERAFDLLLQSHLDEHRHRQAERNRIEQGDMAAYQSGLLQLAHSR